MKTEPTQILQIKPDIQASPIQIGDADASGPQKLMVDLAIRFGPFIIVAGWSTAKLELGLTIEKGGLDTRKVLVPRPDVTSSYGLPSGNEPGFALVAEGVDEAEISLCWQSDWTRGASGPLQFRAVSGLDDLSMSERTLIGSVLGLFALSHTPDSDQWISLVKNIPTSTEPCVTAKGILEGAVSSGKTWDAVVFGWLVKTPGSTVWLEDELGNAYSLEGSYRRFRQDVHDAVGQEFSHASRESGFIARVHGLKPGIKVQLKSISETGVHVLNEIQCSSLPVDPVAAARFLFGMATPMFDFYHRVLAVDEPLLAPLIECHQQVLGELPVQLKQLGEPVAQPTVSIIVPLYGRTDFVEHQLIEFANDPWFAEHAELIYVLDDPHMLEGLTAEAEFLHKLYRLPFRWIWGSVNRGFSGANNLGAKHARGDYLVFLNSDVFPQQPGWLEALIEVLATRPDIGAVGPRLVFADGSIQHAGMEFMRRDELGVWVNHHPYMGLDPSMDPHHELTIVPAVTGACLAMRRTDFDRLGGWDTGYLIGDFEDSDLCLKLRSEGLKSGYLPTVQLTHLERQSFKLLGQDEFRARVVIYNAVRHQKRWATQIEAAQHEASAAA